MDSGLIDALREAPEIILYGASSGGGRVYYNLLQFCIDPARIHFFDSDPAKQGLEFLGRPILSMAQFESLSREVLMVVSSTMAYEILPSLVMKGFRNCHYVHELIFSHKAFEKYDDRFKELLDSLRLSNMNYDELYTLYHSARALQRIPGAVAEVGVYKGGSAFLLASLSGGRKLFLFDTFRGLPGHGTSSGRRPPIDNEPSPGWLSDTEEDAVRHFVLGSGIAAEDLHLRAGYFPDTASDLTDEVFALVHLDTDLYQTTIDALKFFYPRMARGGRLITHDYNASGCPGVRQAFLHYFESLGMEHHIIEISESQAMVLKC